MWRHLASNALTLLIVGMVVAIGALTWAQRQYSATGPLAEAICLKVPRGANMHVVADLLVAQKAIDSPWLIRVGADYSGKATQIKFGSYVIHERASMSEIVDLISESGHSTCGAKVVYRVAVNSQIMRVQLREPDEDAFDVAAEFDPVSDEAPTAYLKSLEDPATRYEIVINEGVTSWRIVNALNAWDLFVGEIEDIPDEGTLAPDTFEVRPGADKADFLASMAALQTKRLADAWEGRSDVSPVKSIEEALVLASIIEKETGLPEERRVVASVFANRLARGIKLQTDPTVIYGVTQGRGVLGRGLRQSELRKETRWNTYIIEGLPPTPIANPGLASIEAALNPDETEFIFFVADGSGGHAFAETLDEHNENVARWRRIEAERENQ